VNSYYSIRSKLLRANLISNWESPETMRNELLAAFEPLIRVPRGTLTGTEELKNLAGWDSLAIIEFIALVDEKSGVELTATDVRRAKRVQDLLDLATSQSAPRP
jgi:acyl carrier protein